MGDFRDVLDTIGEVLDTVQHGYDRTMDSINNMDDVVERLVTEEDFILAAEYEEKAKRCKIRTFVFCILMVAITILVCFFL